MNEFVPRTEPVVSAVSATERSKAGFPGVKPGTGASQAEAGAHEDPQLTERSAVAASYAKLQANIADILARIGPLQAGGSAQAVDNANQSLMSLMPQPVVMLPMPPTNQHMVDFVAQVAQSMAQQAALARAAQAHAAPATVDALIH